MIMRRDFSVLVVMALIFLAGPVPAQELGRFNVMGVALTPTVRVGYQSMTTNINVPVVFDQFVIELANRAPLDLTLKNLGVWVGGIDLNARVGRFSALVSAEASAPKNITLDAQQEPFYAGLSRVQWQGSRFQWSSFDGRGSFDVVPGISLKAGFKVRQWSVKLGGPSDPIGLIQIYHSIFGDNYTADLLTKAWIPYVGAGFCGPHFKASLLFSPVAWVDAKVPFRYLYVSIPHSNLALGYEDDRYRLRRTGLFLELAMGADFVVLPGVKCSLWGKGDWLRINGNGTQNYEGQFVAGGVQTFQLNDSSSAVGSFTSYNLSGGLAVEGIF
jgi:hypothetical protein